jgi:GT2 family glycosyltransferase
VIDVFVVIYHPDTPQLAALIDKVIDAHRQGVPVALRLWHNDGEAPTSGELAQLYERARSSGIEVSVGGGEGNLGFGSGVNRMLRECAASHVLVLNQDAIPEADAIALLWSEAQAAPAAVAAWEMRQIPFEHPKVYDPVSKETEWVSGAAVMFRVAALREAGGFEPRIFMYGEDVDLSWRLRCAGHVLHYCPRSAVVHRTYDKPDQVKPLQALEGIYVNLCLRARYSGHRNILQGLLMAAAEISIPQSFPGRRRGIARAVLKFARNYRYFWNTRKSAPGFEPRFAGWGYEIRRDGAFHNFLPRAEQPDVLPLVSVLVRTHRRGPFLRQALQSIEAQTHRPIEVVVVEDGSDEGEAVCREFEGRLDVRYHRISPGRGRSVAGNQALALARGEWFCFLDDDDLFFADHVEVLLQTVREHGLKGAYALSWRTTTRIDDASVPKYQELSWDRVPDEPFSRVAMWHHNFMPIQAVLFHRSLYESYGGFAEDMDQLEDWNLWTRYTMRDDFVQVRKTTSKYRVPAEAHISAERQQKLDEAYRDAVRRQASITFEADPVLVRKLAEDYARSNALLHVGRDQIRSHLMSSPFLRRIFSLRTALRRRLS